MLIFKNHFIVLRFENKHILILKGSKSRNSQQRLSARSSERFPLPTVRQSGGETDERTEGRAEG